VQVVPECRAWSCTSKSQFAQESAKVALRYTSKTSLRQLIMAFRSNLLIKTGSGEPRENFSLQPIIHAQPIIHVQSIHQQHCHGWISQEEQRQHWHSPCVDQRGQKGQGHARPNSRARPCSARVQLPLSQAQRRGDVKSFLDSDPPQSLASVEGQPWDGEEVCWSVCAN
jgi:hypothetical protein